MSRVIVDADYLVYAAGHAVQKVRYDVTVERPSGETQETICWSMDEARAWLLDEPEGTKSQIDRVVEAEPLGHAIFLTNRILDGVDTFLAQKGVEFNRMELFLTGIGNFRDRIATIKEYKGNRDPDAKPFHYKSLRRYLQNKWGAKVVDGYEADDQLAMIATADRDVVMVSVDKDLLTVPGRHYHFQKKLLFDQSPEEARASFYRQLITGDPVDNIGGAFRAGAKMAAEFGTHLTEEEMYDRALEIYKWSKDLKGCPYAHLSAEDALLENARLLHLLRRPDDVWLPPRDRLPVIARASSRASRRN